METNNNKNGSKNIVPEHQLGVQVGNANIISEVKQMRKKNFINDIISKNIPISEFECLWCEGDLHLCDQGNDPYVLCYSCGFDSRKSDLHTTLVRIGIYEKLRCYDCKRGSDCLNSCSQQIDKDFFSEECSDEDLYFYEDGDEGED